MDNIAILIPDWRDAEAKKWWVVDVDRSRIDLHDKMVFLRWMVDWNALQHEHRPWANVNARVLSREPLTNDKRDALYAAAMNIVVAEVADG